MSKITSELLLSPQDLFTSSTTKGTNLGAVGHSEDGRAFRYVLAGAVALVPGKLQQTSAEVTADENLAPNATYAIGATQIICSTTSSTVANYYSDGYAVITTTPGQGYFYQINSNLAVASSLITVNIQDPLVVALTTSSKVDLVANPYKGVVVNPTTQTGAVAGVAITATPIANYGWIQTGGPSNVLAGAAITVGNQVGIFNPTAGACATTTTSFIGHAMTGIASGDYGLVDLALD